MAPNMESLCRDVAALAAGRLGIELEIARRPELAALIVSNETLGPSPMPPWLARQEVDGGLRADLQAFFLRLHEDELGSRLLEAYNLVRFVAVDHAHYDPIRSMAAEAAGVEL